METFTFLFCRRLFLILILSILWMDVCSVSVCRIRSFWLKHTKYGGLVKTMKTRSSIQFSSLTGLTLFFYRSNTFCWLTKYHAMKIPKWYTIQAVGSVKSIKRCVPFLLMHFFIQVLSFIRYMYVFLTQIYCLKIYHKTCTISFLFRFRWRCPFITENQRALERFWAYEI